MRRPSDGGGLKNKMEKKIVGTLLNESHTSEKENLAQLFVVLGNICSSVARSHWHSIISTLQEEWAEPTYNWRRLLRSPRGTAIITSTQTSALIVHSVTNFVKERAKQFLLLLEIMSSQSYTTTGEFKKASCHNAGGLVDSRPLPLNNSHIWNPNIAKIHHKAVTSFSIVCAAARHSPPTQPQQDNPINPGL